jgi:DNA polymerase II
MESAVLIALHEGFIVHASYQTSRNGTRIFLIGRLRTGETFAVVEDRAGPGFYVRESNLDAVRGMDGIKASEITDSQFTTPDGESVFWLKWTAIADQQDAARVLSYRGIRTYEADIRFYDQFLIDSGIYGAVSIEGPAVKGRRVDMVFHNPLLTPSDWVPRLSVLSVDIETNPGTGEILSISFATDVAWRQKRREAVLFLGDSVKDDTVTCFSTEKAMLESSRDLIEEIDPDIITGWNVIEFDFRYIFDRFKHFGVPFTVGRSDEPGNYLPGAKGQSSAVIIPGRQVLDGMRIMRSGPMRFDDNRLETAAREVLGSGKVAFSEEENLRGRRKIEALLKTYREDPATFCRYNLMDAILVIDILEKTGLMELTVRRAALTGIGLARAWTSVASFEHLYIASMHKRGLVAPTHGVDAFEVTSAPGGAIIPPQPGLYKNVLVYDFKSLYPSIMRTFNLDPVSFVSSHASIMQDELDTLIQAPNGAYFRREEAILPEMLARFFERRESAKESDDQVASYVYKIIMNSFYGVLGTSGCRFASSDIAGAITSFGHHFLIWCKENLENRGYRVIYGDTDSLFVLLPPSKANDSVQATAKIAASISADINYSLSRYIHDKWQVESKLELEYECLYLHFFLPPIRGTFLGVDKNGEMPQIRGRAKGYAGMRLASDRSEERDAVFEIKGMEAVRRDWTQAAKKMQTELLTMVFSDRSVDDLREFTRNYIKELLSGQYDSDLVYKKALRKPVSAYTKSIPPHVRAAMILEEEDQRGVIEYVWTESGPQPVDKLTAGIDYEHYLQKQLKPVAEGISMILQADLGPLFANNLQNDLF